MANVLEQLKGYTTVVADTGNFEGIYFSEFKDFLIFFLIFYNKILFTPPQVIILPFCWLPLCYHDYHRK